VPLYPPIAAVSLTRRAKIFKSPNLARTLNFQWIFTTEFSQQFVSFGVIPSCYARIHSNVCRQGFSIMSAAAQVTDATFDQEVIASEVPVLVDFWAPWCGPCRMVAPVVDEIATQYEGKVKVVKINTDDNPSVANKYGIRSIPTLMIFKGGQKVDTVVGAVPKTTLANTLDKYL
jgi:thioredoxin 1